MVILALSIGSLALVAATVSIVLTARERKRNQERNAAYKNMVSTMVKEHRISMENYVFMQLKNFDGANAAALKDMRDIFERRLSDLEGGMIPDYEKAKQAAKAVNDFSAGLQNILSFDPMEALRQSREQEGER